MRRDSNPRPPGDRQAFQFEWSGPCRMFNRFACVACFSHRVPHTLDFGTRQKCATCGRNHCVFNEGCTGSKGRILIRPRKYFCSLRSIIWIVRQRFSLGSTSTTSFVLAQPQGLHHARRSNGTCPPADRHQSLHNTEFAWAFAIQCGGIHRSDEFTTYTTVREATCVKVIPVIPFSWSMEVVGGRGRQ